jgi:uncharacterized membrane protein
MTDEVEKRFKAIEERIQTIEETLKLSQSKPQSVPAPVATPRIALQTPLPTSPTSSASMGATEILGWGSVAALILAASYVIRMAVSIGWLTPVRQIVLTFIFGLTLIAIGFSLKEKHPRYASLLPGAGLVILFLADYGGHLYYKLLSPLYAIVGVMVICAFALVIARVFSSDLYPLVAVAGSYSAPILLKTFHQDPLDLAIYFTAWGLLFCWYAIKVGQRRVYLLAAYLALIIFDSAWRSGLSGDWEGAITFQIVQFFLFTTATAIFSIVYKAPLGICSVRSHLPVLMIFYFLQYSTLQQHLPQWAPWIACWSFAALLGVYAVMKAYFSWMGASRLIIAIYGAVVLFHAVYLELLPDRTRPWVSLGIILVLGFLISSHPKDVFNWSPLFYMAIIIFVLSDSRLLLSWEIYQVPGHQLLLPLYAIALYVGYSLVQEQHEMDQFSPWLLYLGHANAMVAAAQLLHGQLAISLTWGVLAVTTLLIATQLANKGVGRSALFVFAVFAVKVWLFDLSGADPLVRIACLLVLGSSLYVGGLLYQKIAKLPDTAART